MVRARILREVQEAVAAQTALRATALNYNLFTGSIELLRVSAGPVERPFFTADRIQAKMSLGALLRGSLVVQNGSSSNLVIDIFIDEQGRSNLPVTKDDGQPSADQLPNFLIERLTANGAFILEDRSNKIAARIPAWILNVAGTNPLSPSHTVQFEVSQPGTASYEGRPLAIDTLRLRGAFTRSEVNIEQFQLATTGLDMVASGTVNGFADPNLNLRATTNIDVVPLLTVAGIQPPPEVAGRLVATVNATNKLSLLDLAADVSGENLTVAQFRQVALNAQAKWSRASGAVELASAQVRAPEGAVALQATWAGSTPESQNRASARIERLDLPRISRLLELTFEVAGGATGSFSAQWRGLAFQEANANANLRLSAAGRDAAKDVLPISATIDARVNNRQVNVSIRDAQALNATLQGDIATTLTAGGEFNGPLSGEVQVFVANAANALADADRFRGIETSATPIGGQAQLQASLGGTLQRPTASATLTGTGINYREIQNLSLRASADYDPTRLAVSDALITWEGSEIQAQGSVGLEGPTKPMAFTARSNNISIPEVMGVLGYDYPVQGRMTLQAQGTGTLERPLITATVQGRELAAYGEQLGELAADIQYTHPEVQISSLTLQRPGGLGSLQANGTYNLDTRGYVIDVDGDALAIRNLQLADIPRIRGVVDVAISGMGTVDNPSADFKITASETEVDERVLGTVTLTGNIANHVAAVAAEAPGYNLRADVEASTQAPHATTAQVVLTGTALAGLPWGPGEPPVRGTVTGRIDATGEPEKWREATAAVNIAEVTLQTDYGEVKNAAPIQLTYKDRSVEIASLQLAGPGSTLSVQGTLPLETTASPGLVRYEGQVDLAVASSLAAGEQKQLDAAGQLVFSGDLRGSLERFTPSGTMRLTDGRFTAEALQSPVEQAQAEIALEGGMLTIQQLTAKLGTGLVTGRGTVPLGLFTLPQQVDVPRMSAPGEFEMAVTGLALESVATLPDNVHGTVTLSVKGAADRPELEALTATATIHQLILNAAGTRVQTTTTPPTITLRGAELNIDRFHLTGTGTEFDLTGGASLSARELRNVQVRGNLNAGLLSTFVEDLAGGGDIQLQATATGPFAEPSVNGFVEMKDGRVSMRDPRVDLTGLDVRLGLAGRTINIERFHGDLNGGTLVASGDVQLGEQITPNVQLALKDVFLDVPEGMQTRSSAGLRLAAQGEELLLSGDVTIHEGGYSAPLDLQRALEVYLQPGGSVQLAGERDPQLARLNFDVNVSTGEPLIMDNNLGKLTFTAGLRVTGDYYRPGLIGRIDLGEDGTLRLQENQYVLDHGTITFVNEDRIAPLLDIVANTKVRDRELAVKISTDDAGEVATDFTSSEPGDTRADVIALLLTGKTAEELEGGQMAAAGERAALALVAGTVSGRLSREVETGLGKTAVRLEPNLIAQEADPTARLTLGQDLTRFLQLIYSMNLTNSSDQIWSVNYNIKPKINTRVTKQTDNTFRFDFQHDIRFGLDRPAAATQTPKVEQFVGAVTFAGDLGVPQEKLRDVFRVKSGDKYAFFDVRDGLDRLEKYYRELGYLESRVRLQRMPEEKEVALTIEVTAGRVVEFVFEGWNPPGKLRDQIRDEWQRGVFDSQRTDASLAHMEDALARDGYLRPTVQAEIRILSERRNVLFTIDRGERYTGSEIVFDGAMGIEPKDLRAQLKSAKLSDKLHSEPREVSEFLTRYYQTQGFLDAKVARPEYEYDEGAKRAESVIRIEEGPHYRWGEFAIDGVTIFSEQEVKTIADLPTGEFYAPQIAQASRDRLEEAYWKKGYRDVKIDYSLARDPERGILAVAVTAREGPQSVVSEIEVEGTQITSDAFVRGQIPFKLGDVLDITKTVDSRRNLYSTGAYSSVDVRATPLNPDLEAAIKRVRLIATVQEPSPFRLRYGVFFDTERGPGAIADLRNQNSLGGGRVIGGRLRYDNDVREGRVFFSQSLLRSLPLRTDAATFIRREFQRTILDDGTTDVFLTDRIGFSAQEGLQLANKFFVTGGYRFERVHTYDQIPDEFLPFDQVVKIAPLTASLTRDTRDDVLDTTKGSFTSHSLEFATATLGSSLTFGRYFGQYFYYLPLSKPAPVPFGGGLKRPRLVYAGGARVGLARGFGGQTVVRSERFFTGGGTTIRGFAQNAVGALDVLGRPRGGEAVLIINNELRFPVKSIFDAAGFLDLGNVYPTLEDMRLTDLRRTGGAGLRVRTPYFLLRLDYGFKLDRRVGESRGQFFFSIGQAF